MELATYRFHRNAILRGAPDCTCSIGDVVNGAIVRKSGLHRDMQDSLARLRAAYFKGAI